MWLDIQLQSQYFAATFDFLFSKRMLVDKRTKKTNKHFFILRFTPTRYTHKLLGLIVDQVPNDKTVTHSQHYRNPRV